MKNEVRKDLPGNSESYLMLEAGKLNQEIENLLGEIRLREKYVFGMLVAAPSWLIIDFIPKNCQSAFQITIIYLIILSQFVIALLIKRSIKLLYNRINFMGDYLKIIENYFFIEKTSLPNSNNFGWEKFHDIVNKSKDFVNFTENVGFGVLYLVALELITYTCYLIFH